MMKNSKSFEEIIDRFRKIMFSEEFDMIVVIANGGIIPAAILNQRLNIQMEWLKINLRNSEHKIKYNSPKLLEPILFEFKNKRILLVDDRVKSGQTLKFASDLLQDAKIIKTFAVNGKADYSLYNEDCFIFPWIL
jgi:xanthine phosphoribosyltransferase